MNLELSDVAVQSLVPAPLQNVASAEDFMQQLPQYDADLAQQVSEADASGECLRFVGKALPCPAQPCPALPSALTPHINNRSVRLMLPATAMLCVLPFCRGCVVWPLFCNVFECCMLCALLHPCLGHNQSTTEAEYVTLKGCCIRTAQQHRLFCSFLFLLRGEALLNSSGKDFSVGVFPFS